MSTSTMMSLLTLFSCAITVACLAMGYERYTTALSAAITSSIGFATLAVYEYEQRKKQRL